MIKLICYWSTGMLFFFLFSFAKKLLGYEDTMILSVSIILAFLVANYIFNEIEKEIKGNKDNK